MPICASEHVSKVNLRLKPFCRLASLLAALLFMTDRTWFCCTWSMRVSLALSQQRPSCLIHVNACTLSMPPTLRQVAHDADSLAASRKLHLFRCSHEDHPVAAAECLQSLVGECAVSVI